METVHPALSITMLGPFAVRISGEPMGKLRSKSGQWLLALLALRAGREVERSWLAAMLWPDADEATGLANLRRTLTDLRAALGPAADHLQSPSTKTLALDPRDCTIDVVEFARLVAEGSEASLLKAVELHAHPLLEGCVEEWIIEEREPLIASYVRSLELLAELAEGGGNRSEAVKWWKQVLSAEPLRESAARNLIRLLAEEGNYGQAVLEFRTLRERLRYQLNLDPSAETLKVFKSIRSEAKGKANEILTATVSTESKFTNSDKASFAVPIPLTPLIGREIESDELCDWISQHRLINVIGSGGMGKTRLAIHVAHRLRDEFAGGVYFVDLSPLDESQFVMTSIANAFGSREVAGVEQEVTFLKEIGEQKILFVLDNCEHLVEAAAYATQRLLTTCANVRILVTSRHQLGLPGEVLWRIPAMETPEDLSLTGEDLMQFDSIRLFVDRARAVRPGFNLSSDSSNAVIGICRKLDGCPLAIELAAARTSVLGVEQIEERLADRFQLLTSSNRVAMPRQQTLRALIDWSYNLLSEPERAGLRALSVFHGGCRLEAAEFVLDPIDLDEMFLGVFDVLAALVEKSLVIMTFDELGPRYSMLESIRAYGVSKLNEEGEESRVQDRHAEYYLELSSQAERGMVTAEQPRWVLIYNFERDNFRVALHGFIEKKRAIQAMTLAFNLWRLWDIRAEFSEGQHLLQQAIEIPYEERTSARARALTALAIMMWRKGDLPSAKRVYTEAQQCAKEVGDKQYLAMATNGLANVANTSADLETALDIYLEALKLYQEIDNHAGVASVYMNLGSVTHTLCRFREAKIYSLKSLEIRRKLGEPRAIASALDALAITVADLGEHDFARACVRESLQIYTSMNSRNGIHLVLNSISEIATAAGDYVEATKFMGASDRWFDEQGITKNTLTSDIENDVNRKLRAELSDEVYEAAYAEGYAMEPVAAMRTYLGE